MAVGHLATAELRGGVFDGPAPSLSTQDLGSSLRADVGERGAGSGGERQDEVLLNSFPDRVISRAPRSETARGVCERPSHPALLRGGAEYLRSEKRAASLLGEPGKARGATAR